MWASSIGVDPRISLGKGGLLLGAGTHLARFADADDRLVVDPTRLEALFAVAFQRAPSERDFAAIAAAASHWHRGDKALANLRLVFADLAQLRESEDAVLLKAAEHLFDAGLRVDNLAKLFGVDLSVDHLEKYDPDQPRVPAGHGKESGRWAALWSRFSAWLAEEVPEYDQETGEQVGTRSRARALLPYAIVAGGTAALLGGEVLLPAAATIAPVAPLTPFAQRYLSTSGGRLGNTATRRQLYEIAEEHAASGKYTTLRGDGRGPEEYLKDPLTGKGTYVDFTARRADGSTVRIQTIDTLKDGVTPTASELRAARQIQKRRPNDKLILVPKR